ncbi:MAG: hypothetical protein ACREQ7_03775 [Candidatus Binatia bacterium]
MKFLTLADFIFATTLTTIALGEAQESHKHSMDMPEKHSEKMPPKAALQPAEGARVDIISPKEGQVFRGDSVPLEFTMKKGKRGEHVHAYVDGELMGMFKTTKGTLTGIKPGRHTLELRVATADHNKELNATDRVSFTTK